MGTVPTLRLCDMDDVAADLAAAEIVSAVQATRAGGRRGALLIEFAADTPAADIVHAVGDVLGMRGVTGVSVCSLTSPGP